MKPVRYLYEKKPAAPTASSSNVPNTLPTTLEEELSAKEKKIQMSVFFVKLRTPILSLVNVIQGTLIIYFEGEMLF